MAFRYFEDFELGSTHELGSATLSSDEIIAFGRAYDPQPFHTDEEAAQASPFGGLIASGWQTAAIAHRLLVGSFAQDAVTFGSPGVDELRFLRPVRPGEPLRLRVGVVEARVSQSKPDRGIIRLWIELLTGLDAAVLSMTGVTIFGRRP